MSSPGVHAHRRAPLVMALVIAAAVGACSGAASSPPAASGGPSAAGGPPQPLTITAKDVAFAPTSFTAPAGRPLEVTFHNEDAGVPHNLVLLAGPSLSDEIVKSEVFTGVADQQVSIPGLVAGAYRFSCNVHPNMTADLTVAP